MIRNILILAVLLGSTALYTVYENKNAIWADIPASTPAAKNREQAPDVAFTSLSGKTYALSDFKGKTIVLNFWASWCAPCVVEFPQMLDLARLKKDAVFVFMSVDEDRRNIDRFLKKMGPSLKLKNVIVAHDKDKSISQTLFQTYKLPETYLINPAFEIHEKIIGIATWNDQTMQDKIDLISQEK